MYFKTIMKIPVILMMVLCFTFTKQVFSQPVLGFQLAPSLELAQVVYVSDFDFLQQGATQFLFQITINNAGQPAVRGYLLFEVIRGDDPLPLASATTKAFNLPENYFVSASNIQLDQGHPIPGDEIIFDESETNYPTDDFQNEVLQGGRLPRGSYRFIVHFRYEDDTDITPPAFQQLDIQNPTYIRPIAPGRQTGQGLLDIVYTPFPTFQFESDFGLTFSGEPPYRVQIFKKLDQHYSVDEALTSTPHFDEFMYETVFPYPVTAALPLDPGVYVWRIQLGLITTSGTEKIESPIFAFRIEDPSNIGVSDDALEADLLRILRDVLGERGANIARTLSDYRLLTIRVNGEKIDKKGFYEIIEGYAEQTRKVSDIEFLGTQQ